MARDSLSTLIRLRRAACDEAQQHVVRCVAEESRAEFTVLEAERSIAREMEAASDPSGPDSVVEAFAAWLPSARRKLEEARRSLETLQAETGRARAGLTACKTALETVETLQRERQEAAHTARERAWQLELEDRPRPPAESGDDRLA